MSRRNNIRTRRSVMRRFALVITLCVAACAASMARAEGTNPMVLMSTSMGDIKIELNAEKAPESVKNFLGYVNDKFYDGTIFHRVIPNFMVQGGGMTPGVSEKKTGLKAPIKNESSNGLSNERGTLAMARTPQPDSATAQFYLNHQDNK